MNTNELLDCISGSSLLRGNQKHRNEVAAKMWELRKLFSGSLKYAHNLYPAPPKFNNPEQLRQRGLDMLNASHQPCPPLPCGADDAWYENAEYARYEAFAFIDAAAILDTREAHRHAPNLHAFDEQYYSN
jgi:hypothetical protein